MSSLSFDDLFALRVELSEEFMDENLIIKELKMILLNNGINDINGVDTYLVEFYNNFGIKIELETIKNIIIPQTTPSINILNQLINQALLNPNFNINNFPINNIISNSTNESTNNTDVLDTYDDMPALESDDDMSALESDDDMPALEYEQNVPILNVNNLMNSFNSLINSIHTIPPNMEDIKVTLKDEKTIKKYKLDTKLESKCSVCLGALEKDNDIWELPCCHVFHQDCIKIWLKEYNYKCPICRKEAGKGKTNI